MDRLLSEQEVKKWLERWIGYLDEDMIYRMKIGTRDIPSAEPKTVKSCDTCKHDEAFGCPSFIHDRCENYSEWEQADKSKCKALEQEPKWIPVSERLPKPKEYIGNVCRYYLIQNEDRDMMVARWDGQGWEQMYQYGEYIEDEVIAWMPLPKPYEPQESEERTDGR